MADQTYRCVQCGHDFERTLVGLDTNGLAYCTDIPACNGRVRVDRKDYWRESPVPGATPGDPSKGDE